MHKAAIFDIITQDLEHGPVAAGAEMIAVMNNIMNSFPNLNQNYVMQVSHSTSTLIPFSTLIVSVD